MRAATDDNCCTDKKTQRRQTHLDKVGEKEERRKQGTKISKKIVLKASVATTFPVYEQARTGDLVTLYGIFIPLLLAAVSIYLVVDDDFL